MSLISAAEDRLLDKYLEAQDCKCAPECIESWGECCGDCPGCERYEDDYEDSTEARWEDQERW